jgi:imidazolonepropionase-like amidohydrolase
MMEIFDNSIRKMTRRDFVRASGAAAAMAALGGLPGCTSVTIKNAPAIDYTKDMIFKNCRAIDVISGKVTQGANILVSKGVIRAVTPDSMTSLKASVIDAGGRYVIPGLIDAHCHPTITSCFAMETSDMGRHMDLQKRQFTIGPEYGITTYRDTGSFPITLHGMIKDIESGKMIGPRVVYCNSILNVRGGHPDVPPSDVHPLAGLVAVFTGMVMANVKNIDELRSVIEKNARGASFIKLTMDNKSVFCRKEDIPVYTDDELDLIFRYADGHGLPVSCHVHRKWGFDRAARYPVNSLEHMVSDAYLSDADIELMVKKKISIVPTMTIGASYLMEEAYDEVPAPYRDDFIINEMKIRKEYLAGEASNHCDPVIHRKNMEALQDYKRVGFDNLWKKKKFIVNPEVYFGMIKYGTKNLMKMREAGVRIGCAIDAGMPLAYFGGLYREMEFMSRAGFRNDEILRCATINNAGIIGMADKIGTLEKGKYADLVLLDRNPLVDVTAYRSPAAVLKQGKFIYCRQTLPVAEPSR